MTGFRKMVFWLTALVYLMICPAVILFALGYFKAGLITLQILPENARVQVAGHEVKGPWPQTVTRVPAGEYEARIEAPGYEAQQRQVRVAQGETTMLNHLLLLPDPVMAEELTSQSFTNLTAMPGTDFILLEREHELFFYDWKKEVLREVTFPKTEGSVGKLLQIFTVDGSSRVFLMVSRGGATYGLYLDLKKISSGLKSPVSVYPLAHPDFVTWGVGHPEVLFSVSKGEVVILSASSHGEESKLSEKKYWRGFGIGEGITYWLDGNGQVIRTETAIIQSQSNIPRPAQQQESLSQEMEIEKAKRLFGEAGFFRIYAKGTQTLFFHGPEGQFLQNELPHVLVEREVAGVRVSPQRERVLLWQKQNAGVIEEPDKTEYMEGQLEQGRDVRWFYQQGNDVRDVQLAYDESHALVLDSNQVLLCELFPGATTAARPVVEIKSRSSFAYIEDKASLFYLDRKKGRLHVIELLPQAGGKKILEPAHE